MSHRIKIIIFSAFIILLLGAVNTGASSKRVIKYDNYHFFFEQGDSVFVATLVSKIARSLTDIEKFFSYRPQSVITILLTRSRTEYEAYARRGLPEWSQAVAFTREKLIILKIETAEELTRSPEILLHELVHIFVAERFPGVRLPVWLNEGIAQYLSGYKLSLDDRITIANALSVKKIMPLSEIDSLFDFSPMKARLAYLQSLAAVQFFVSEYGADALQQLIQNFAESRSLNESFSAAVGHDFIDFEIFWYEDLRSKNRWLILLNIDHIIWVIMGVLAIMAIIFVHFRNKRVMRSWEDEIPLNEE